MGKIKPQPKKKKPKTLPQLEKILDSVFSQYIRLKYSDDGRTCQCYTCGTVGEIKDMQCGHLFSRAKKNVRFDPENCRVQCVSCNVFKHGNYDVYHPKIIREIGEADYFALVERSKIPVKRSREWYNQMIETYNEKVRSLKNGIDKFSGIDW